jgi:capsular exopolysaccharide synthesis family protein
MVGISFLVVFIYIFATFSSQYTVEATVRIASGVEVQTIGDREAMVNIAGKITDNSLGLIENSDTIAKALQATSLGTTYDPAEFKKNIKAERIGSSDNIKITLNFDGSDSVAMLFMANFLDACKSTIDTAFVSEGFAAEISETGRIVGETSRIMPAFLYGLYAALIMLGLFLLIQFLSFIADNTLRSNARFDKITDVPVITAIPSVSRMGGIDRGGSKIGNAFRVLRSAVKYSEKKVRSIAVCSASPKDGRTSVAIGLATALAETDAMVLLIEADMRRPNISPEMRIESVFGLADLLLGKTNLAATICKTSNRNLYVITAVNNTNLSNVNIADLLDSVVFDELLEAVQSQFDYVIIDTPSVELVPDATAVAGKVDSIVVVAQYGHTKADALKAAMGVFGAMGGDIMGVVTTNSPQRTGFFGSVSNYYRSAKSEAKAGFFRALFGARKAE